MSTRKLVIIEHDWRPIIGTLANPGSFTAREVTEYTRFGRRLNGASVVRKLYRAGFIERNLLAWGQYHLTPAGRRWVEGVQA